MEMDLVTLHGIRNIKHYKLSIFIVENYFGGKNKSTLLLLYSR